MQLEEGSIAWSTKIEEYCRDIIERVDKMLELYGNQPLKVFGTKSGQRTFMAPYRPEIDVTKVIGGDIQ